MKTYAIDFKSVNVKKETISCISFIQSETLFLAIHTFEEKNRGRGYITLSVREVDNNELSAINSLKKNVTFWFNECGLSKEGVLREIESWFNFAFTTKEQNEAKREVINLLNKN
ncbi:hypothetical protein ACM55R_23280 [Enterobacter hormaechei]|uniref:hypothetical protein n=1 Tax=Enterobacter hormaechei TaxID=158836 RepID=UPI0039FBD376|nr:hypothetical protein [Escherichia coli]